MITIGKYVKEEGIENIDIDENNITHFSKIAFKTYTKKGDFKKWCFKGIVNYLDNGNLVNIKTFASDIENIKEILKGKYHSTHTTEEAYKGKYNSVRKGISWYYTVDAFTKEE